MELLKEIKQSKRQIDFEFNRCYNKNRKAIYLSDYNDIFYMIFETISLIGKLKGVKNKIIGKKIKFELQSMFIKLDMANKIDVNLQEEKQWKKIIIDEVYGNDILELNNRVNSFIEEYPQYEVLNVNTKSHYTHLNKEFLGAQVTLSLKAKYETPEEFMDDKRENY